MSCSFGSKTVRTIHDVFLVALPIIYFVRFIVLMYVLVSFVKVCVCAVIPFCRVSCVDPKNAGSAE